MNSAETSTSLNRIASYMRDPHQNGFGTAKLETEDFALVREFQPEISHPSSAIVKVHEALFTLLPNGTLMPHNPEV